MDTLIAWFQALPDNYATIVMFAGAFAVLIGASFIEHKMKERAKKKNMASHSPKY